MFNNITKNYMNFYSEDYLDFIVENNLNYSTASGVDNMNYNFFIKNKKKIINEIRYKVLLDEYKFKPYKELLILKDKYSIPRCISIPTITDRICLRALNDLLNYHFSNVNKQAIPQSLISRIQKNIDSYDSYLKLDLSNFYGTIRHDLLIEKLEKKIKDKIIINLVKNAIQNTTGDEPKVKDKNSSGLPQGISISNTLAHIFLSDLDSYYENKSDLMYCRYVDDILIFCRKDNFDTIQDFLIKELQNTYQLKLNLEKQAYGELNKLTRDKPLKFLGYTFFKGKKKKKKKKTNINTTYITSVRKESRLNIEKKIVTLLNNFDKEKSTVKKNLTIHELNRLITGSFSTLIDNDIQKIKRFGWLFFYSQINDETLLWHLDAFVDKKIGDLMRKNSNLDQYIGEIKLKKKSFVRAYYEIKYNFEKTNYIFCPDKYNNLDKIVFLEENLGISMEKLRNLSDDQIDKKFKSYIYRKIKRDEKDLIKIVAKSD